jgi:hypothetical protein
MFVFRTALHPVSSGGSCMSVSTAISSHSRPLLATWPRDNLLLWVGKLLAVQHWPDYEAARVDFGGSNTIMKIITTLHVADIEVCVIRVLAVVELTLHEYAFW